jgi:hypothetical protein
MHIAITQIVGKNEDNIRRGITCPGQRKYA